MPKEFICEDCDFKCFNSSNYVKHKATAKHKMNQLEINGNKPLISCVCGKKYHTRSGLFKHKKLCNYKTPEEKITELLLQQQEEHKREQIMLLKNQQEQQMRLIEERYEEQRKRDEEQRKRDEERYERYEEQYKRYEERTEQIQVLIDKISGMSLVTNHNNNITNNNNNITNNNFCLNTQCKDAIDFNSFLRSITVDDEDLHLHIHRTNNKLKMRTMALLSIKKNNDVGCV